MNPSSADRPPRWWGPKLSPWCIRLCRPLRRWAQRRQQRLLHVEVRGVEQVQRALTAGQGVLITPNHSGHADAFIMGEAADCIGLPCHFMVAWQVFARRWPLGQWLLARHGCFSVDREGSDLQAFRQAVELLGESRHPLVVFPEGEVYHLNERVTPFREGAAAMALSAARRGNRPVACVPCAIQYRYVSDPTPELNELMGKLERALLWRPCPDWPLQRRIYRLAEGLLALKELEYLGAAQTGPLPQRGHALSEHVLSKLQQRHGTTRRNVTVPERVKRLRQAALTSLQPLPLDAPERSALLHDLDDLFLVVQLFSYPGDYVSERPTIERMAETLDKFEEDVFQRPMATVRATRRAVVAFCEPVVIEPEGERKHAAAAVTLLLERRVQKLLDDLSRNAAATVHPT